MSDDRVQDAAATVAKPVVYVVVQSSWGGGNLGGCLLLATGEVLWSHMSSGPEWLKRDLTDGFTDRRERLNVLYPDGYEVIYVDKEDLIPAEVLAANAAWKAADDDHMEASEHGESRG